MGLNCIHQRRHQTSDKNSIGELFLSLSPKSHLINHRSCQHSTLVYAKPAVYNVIDCHEKKQFSHCRHLTGMILAIHSKAINQVT